MDHSPHAAPLVSVITPAYNHARYVDQYLDSVIAQTYQNIELLLLNDGSTDRTGERVAARIPELERRFARVVYVTKPNEGICRTLNAGVAMARGDYIKLVSSDDALVPEAIARYAEVMEARPDLLACYSDGYRVPDDEMAAMNAVPPGASRFSDRLPFRSGDLSSLILKRVFELTFVGLFFRRDCFDIVGPFDEALSFEDIDYMIRLARATPLHGFDDCLVHKRVHGTNIGVNYAFMLPGIDALIRKVAADPSFGEADRQTLLLTLSKRAANFQPALDAMRGRRLVGWGTGSNYRNAMDRHGFELDYLVDSDPTRQGTVVDGVPIRAPEELLAAPNGAYVLVFTQFFDAVYARLEQAGLHHRVDFY